ncbi:MAG: sugar phosphate isomerase/epimerase [Pseudomonadota bacterium]
MPLLSLAHLTLLGADPIQLIDAAAAAGFTHIGMRIVPPTADAPMRPVIGDAPFQHAIRSRLAGSGVRLFDIEAFWLSPETDVAALEPAFAFGAELGAAHALVVGNDPERTRLIDNFAGVSELARRYGLKTSLEFIPYSAVRTLAEAGEIIAAAGQSNAGLLVDALHLSRSGGVPADLTRLQPELLHYLHLCDALVPPPTDIAGMRQEARSRRCYPGEGLLPLQAFLAAASAELPIGIEAPDGRRAGLPFAEQAHQVRTAALKLLAGNDH